MGTLYVDTGGAATNSGSTDQNAADLSGTAATVAGSVVTLDGAPDLSGLVTSGATQSAIYINDATNANTKIFWITAFDNGADTVTVSVAPTGVTSSSWAIGGRHVYTKASIEGAVRGGDTLIFNNSPASDTTDIFTTRNTGTATTGLAVVKGKTGVRPVLTNTSTTQCIEIAHTGYKFENLEIAQQGASNAAVNCGPVNGSVFYNVKFSDAGTDGIASGSSANGYVLNCEFTGVGQHAINYSGNLCIVGNYIHDITGSGISPFGANPSSAIINNVIDTCGGRGIWLSGASTAFGTMLIQNNTIYGCGDSGLEVTDADTQAFLFGNIFAENGNAAGEYNVEYVAGTNEANAMHSNNIFFHSGGGGGANLSGLTTNSTESTSNPLFTNAASGDFSISSASPAKATGFPTQYLGANANYLDMGAVQRQESAGETCVASLS